MLVASRCTSGMFSVCIHSYMLSSFISTSWTLQHFKFRHPTLVAQNCQFDHLPFSPSRAGRLILDAIAFPASEEADYYSYITALSELRVVPPAKCFKTFAQEADRSAATCLTLPQGTERSSNTSADGSVISRISITCGKDTTIPADKLGSCPDAQATLDAHNAARAPWGAAPLLWSKTLADYAQTVSDTCQFAHSNGPYGENLAIGSGLSCKGALDLWMAEQSQWPPGGTPGFSSATGHFSAVVWKSTTQVGCAICSCSGRNFVTCSYNPPGNVIGQFDTGVGQQGQTPDCLATTGPSTPTTPSTLPPVSRPVSPPPPSAVVKSPPPPRRTRCCYFNICFRC